MAEEKLENPFIDTNQNNPKEEKQSWPGLLYIFPYCYYLIIVVLFGEKSRNKPECFSNVKLSDYLLNGGFHIRKLFKRFFCGPSKSATRDLDFVDKLALLLEPGNFTNDIMQKSKELSALHREYENTKARKRLEKWSLGIIIVYLLVVLCLIICNYFSVNFKGILSVFNEIKCNIPDKVMIVILSTTTVNIIGLGLIVLRGYFLAKENKKNDKADN